MGFSQRFERCDTIHHWHFHVQSHDVRVELLHLWKGNFSVSCHADHLNLRICLEEVREETSNNGRIVNDKDADFIHGISAKDSCTEACGVRAYPR